MAQSDAKVLVNEEELKEEDEIVRTYGSTNELPTLKKQTNTNSNSISENSVVVKIEDIRIDGKNDRLRLPDDVCNDAAHDIRSLHDDDACDNSLSKDSDSLIQDVHYSSVQTDSSKCWWTHPKVRENWRTVLSAFVLFIIGTSLLVAGVVVEILPHAGLQGFVFLIAGGICFIPGAYHIVYIYCAVKGKRGYDFYHLPLFN